MKQDPIYTQGTDWFTAHSTQWSQWFSPFLHAPNLQFLEIGCFEGRSALWLLQHVLTDPSSRLVCVDPLDGKSRCDTGGTYASHAVEEHFLHNIAQSGQQEQVTFLKAYSGVALRSFALDRFDAIYIDGDHRAPEVLEDGVLAWRLLKSGGILLFDDYRWAPKGRSRCDRPKVAVDAFLAVYAERMEVVEKGYQVVVRKK
jgi:predicted O-methyltransferase YrrM